MPSLSVIPVQSRREKTQFLELPWQLYQGDENWIPPLRGNQKELLNYKKHASKKGAQSNLLSWKRVSYVAFKVTGGSQTTCYLDDIHLSN